MPNHKTSASSTAHLSDLTHKLFALVVRVLHGPVEKNRVHRSVLKHNVDGILVRVGRDDRDVLLLQVLLKEL